MKMLLICPFYIKSPRYSQTFELYRRTTLKSPMDIPLIGRQTTRVWQRLAFPKKIPLRAKIRHKATSLSRNIQSDLPQTYHFIVQSICNTDVMIDVKLKSMRLGIHDFHNSCC